MVTGFAEKTDGNTIDIFEKIFSKTIIKNFKITNNLNIANVLFESVFGNTLADIKIWKYKILFSGEPYITNSEKYDLLLFSHETQQNIVDVPLYVIYMYDNALLNRIVNKPKITKIPEKKKSDEKILSNGGRVLGVTSLGDSLDSAISNVYSATEKIIWSNKYCRKDIGKKGLSYF